MIRNTGIWWWLICFKKIQWFKIENKQSPVYVVNYHFSKSPDRCYPVPQEVSKKGQVKVESSTFIK